VTKDVQKLRDYEAALLRGYQAYLRTLLAAAKGGSIASGRVAARCMCELLAAKPHFNYSTDLLQAIVPRMASGDAPVAEACCAAVSALLAGDTAGRAALECVQLVADLVKRRKCVCAPAIVRSLLVLNLREAKRPEAGEGGRRGKKGAAKKEAAGKKGAAKKKGREADDVDRAFAEAEMAPDAAELAVVQSQTLEALFEVFFRVLKHCTATGAAPGAAAAGPWPASRVARRLPLLYVSLEGLSKYTHLISVDYFNDLMAVFGDVARRARGAGRQRAVLRRAALRARSRRASVLGAKRRSAASTPLPLCAHLPLRLRLAP